MAGVRQGQRTDRCASGPKSQDVLASLTKADLAALTFGKSTYADVAGVECHIARGGYTGGDGFEVRAERLLPPPALLIAAADLDPAGGDGARDAGAA